MEISLIHKLCYKHGHNIAYVACHFFSTGLLEYYKADGLGFTFQRFSFLYT